MDFNLDGHLITSIDNILEVKLPKFYVEYNKRNIDSMIIKNHDEIFKNLLMNSDMYIKDISSLIDHINGKYKTNLHISNLSDKLAHYVKVATQDIPPENFEFDIEEYIMEVIVEIKNEIYAIQFLPNYDGLDHKIGQLINLRDTTKSFIQYK